MINLLQTKEVVDLLFLRGNLSDLGRERMSRGIFEFVKKNVFNIILDPKSTIIVLNMQNDYFSGPTSLDNYAADQNATGIIPVVNQILRKTKFLKVYYT